MSKDNINNLIHLNQPTTGMYCSGIGSENKLCSNTSGSGTGGGSETGNSTGSSIFDQNSTSYGAQCPTGSGASGQNSKMSQLIQLVQAIIQLLQKGGSSGSGGSSGLSNSTGGSSSPIETGSSSQPLDSSGGCSTPTETSSSTPTETSSSTPTQITQKSTGDKAMDQGLQIAEQYLQKSGQGDIAKYLAQAKISKGSLPKGAGALTKGNSVTITNKESDPMQIAEYFVHEGVHLKQNKQLGNPNDSIALEKQAYAAQNNFNSAYGQKQVDTNKMLKSSLYKNLK